VIFHFSFFIESGGFKLEVHHNRSEGTTVNSHAREGVEIGVIRQKRRRRDSELSLSRDCRSFGPGDTSFHVFHSLTGVAINCRPFGSALHF
jgi:hypothetical protein